MAPLHVIKLACRPPKADAVELFPARNPKPGPIRPEPFFIFNPPVLFDYTRMVADSGLAPRALKS